MKRGLVHPGLSPRLANPPPSATQMAHVNVMQHLVARQRLRDCGKCGTSKAILKSGASRCLVCHNRRGREYCHNSTTRRRKQRESYVMRKYGLSIELLQELLHEQAGRCAISLKRWQDCTRAKCTHDDTIFLQYLYVDHAHKTGKVRGLLCNACNTAIGLLEEDRARLLSALSYLDEQESRRPSTAIFAGKSPPCGARRFRRALDCNVRGLPCLARPYCKSRAWRRNDKTRTRRCPL
jgi:hypothetical protein